MKFLGEIQSTAHFPLTEKHSFPKNLFLLESFWNDFFVYSKNLLSAAATLLQFMFNYSLI